MFNLCDCPFIGLIIVSDFAGSADVPFLIFRCRASWLTLTDNMIKYTNFDVTSKNLFHKLDHSRIPFFLKRRPDIRELVLPVYQLEAILVECEIGFMASDVRDLDPCTGVDDICVGDFSLCEGNVGVERFLGCPFRI